MKELFFKLCMFVAAMTATVGLSSCSQDEVESTTSKTVGSKAISFNVTTDNAKGTRGTATTSSNYLNQMKDFSVFAVFGDLSDAYNGDAYFGKWAEGTQGSGVMDLSSLPILNGDGKGHWYYKNPNDSAYWPGSSPLSFFAISPATNDNYGKYTYDDGSFHLSPMFNFLTLYPHSTNVANFDYTVPTEPSKQVDVMYSFASGASTNNGVVSLNFAHALSQVNFKAKTDNSNLSVTISGIKLHNIFSQVIVNFLSGFVSAPTQNGVFTDTRDNYSAVISNPVTFTSKSGTTQISDADNVLMLAPQVSFNSIYTNICKPWDVSRSISTIEADEEHATLDNEIVPEQYLEITCKITYSGQYLVGSDDAYGTVYVPLTTGWTSGFKYTYILDFGGGYDADGKAILSPITYTVTTDDWTDAPSSSVTL